MTDDDRVERVAKAISHKHGLRTGRTLEQWLANTMARAALAAAEPQGWKLVPVEPTIPMCLAGEEAIRNIPRTGVVPVETEQSQECWAAMVKAAPLPPPPGGDR
jgi:hypothetical protein